MYRTIKDIEISMALLDSMGVQRQPTGFHHVAIAEDDFACLAGDPVFQLLVRGLPVKRPEDLPRGSVTIVCGCLLIRDATWIEAEEARKRAQAEVGG